MKKVITYGTYDLLHYGHIRLLERAKALGDYLIVGVTSDGFDRTRGKINVQQSLMERIDAVRATGIADQIVVEEYEGQKIDDIVKYGIDIFTVGSDWVGKFDYLNEYCKVVYLDRTQGISSSELRSEERKIRIGLIGGSQNTMGVLAKFERESHYANGVEISGICTDCETLPLNLSVLPTVTQSYEELLEASDAVYVASLPRQHYEHIAIALDAGKHVICESPVTVEESQYAALQKKASEKHIVLMDAIKTAFSVAYNRMIVLAKSGRIGNIVSVDSVCTSLIDIEERQYDEVWNSISAWGPTALMPIFQLLGTKYHNCRIVSKKSNREDDYDLFTKVMFEYDGAVASLKVGQGVKSEGQLIISGTQGYIYVPAPWWKTDYFELRYENPANNKRYFYQLDGEGIRNEIVAFAKAIKTQEVEMGIGGNISQAIIRVMQDYRYAHII